MNKVFFNKKIIVFTSIFILISIIWIGTIANINRENLVSTRISAINYGPIRDGGEKFSYVSNETVSNIDISNVNNFNNYSFYWFELKIEIWNSYFSTIKLDHSRYPGEIFSKYSNLNQIRLSYNLDFDTIIAYDIGIMEVKPGISEEDVTLYLRTNYSISEIPLCYQSIAPATCYETQVNLKSNSSHEIINEETPSNWGSINYTKQLIIPIIVPIFVMMGVMYLIKKKWYEYWLILFID